MNDFIIIIMIYLGLSLEEKQTQIEELQRTLEIQMLHHKEEIDHKQQEIDNLKEQLNKRTNYILKMNLVLGENKKINQVKKKEN